MSLPDKLISNSTSAMQTTRSKLTTLTTGLLSLGRAPTSTTADELTRQRQGFPQIESSLPARVTDSTPASNLLDRVLAFTLGDKNPLAKEAEAATDVVWLLDNTAYRPDGDENAEWEAEFVAAYFARHTGKDLSAAVAKIADLIGLDGKVGAGEGEKARKTVEMRLRPFALAIRPARYVGVVWRGEEMLQLGPGNSNGISSQIQKGLGTHSSGDVAQSSPEPASLDPHAPASTYFADPEGWAVISDIDDSIKITMTSSPIGVLQSTFYDDPTPITGMPELYAHINTLLNPSWFYLSASPYTLYPFLRPFLRAHYPTGTTILRDASWQDLNGLLQSFTVGTEAYKTSRIEKIHTWLPKKKLVCVGDSTQSDPEAYGDMARKYPDWVKVVFIRKVLGVSGVDDAGKNEEARFEKAFEGVPRSKWMVFEDPKELYAAVDALKTV